MTSYVYRFINIKGEVIYYGKTIDINNRMHTHFTNGHLDKKCYKSVAKIEYQKYKTESDALIMETYYITKYSPKYNTLSKSRDIPTIQFEEKEWKTYQILKQQHPKYEAEKGILTWIMWGALAYAIFEFLFLK